MWLNANISCCLTEVNKLSNLLFYLEILIIFTAANPPESSEMILSFQPWIWYQREMAALWMWSIE